MCATAKPNAPALIEPGGVELTFARLQNCIEAIAQAVISAQINSDEVVALVSPGGAGLLVSFLGQTTGSRRGICVRLSHIACNISLPDTMA
jgi:hypothetical protein